MPNKERATKWYGVGIPGYGKKRVPLAKNKDAAQRELETLVRKAEQGQAGMPDADSTRRRLADQAEAFGKDLGLGLAARGKRKKRPPSDKQVRLAVQRVRDVLDGCKFVHVGDLNETAPAKLANYLNDRVARPKKDGGISHQTAAFYLAAVVRFVWWLSVRKRARVSAILFDDIPGFDPTNHRKHGRRSIPPDDLARILDVTRAGLEAEGLTGEQRYFLYLVAFGTGFRAQELRSLKPESFELATDRPLVRLSGKVAKNRKHAAQLLPIGVALQLSDFLAPLPKGEPVWPGGWTRKGARMLRVDLAAAGVPYSVEGPSGPEFADFHSLRHSFVSALAEANVGPKVLQELARHSTARLTLERYTHTDQDQLAGALNRLPIGGSAGAGDGLTQGQLVAGLAAALTVLGHILGASATMGATGNGSPGIASGF